MKEVIDFLTLAKARCSVREFESLKVTEEEYAKILEAGRVAPTAANLQPQRILVIRSEEGLAKLKKAGNVYGAPLAFIICADHKSSWKRPGDGKDTADIDASIVTTHMMLQAAALGLQSIWVCHFKAESICLEFNLPKGVEPINLLGIGHSARGIGSPTNRHASQRKPIEETTFEESF